MGQSARLANLHTLEVTLQIPSQYISSLRATDTLRALVHLSHPTHHQKHIESQPPKVGDQR